MIAEKLISRLEKVRQTGRDSWRACCPGHGGTNPTALTIRETDDGRLLLKCFHGCSVEQIVSAVGLDMSDLFPPQAIDHHKPKERLQFNPRDVLAATGFEASIVLMCGIDLAKGKVLTDDQMERLKLAVSRIKSSVEAANAAAA